MAHCNLCNKNTRCSCKGGWCPSCNSTNKQVSFINDLLKFWISKNLVKEKINQIRTYVDKVDAYTVYEYLAWVIDEDAFKEALNKFIPTRKKDFEAKKNEVVDTSWRVNPEKMCVYKWTSPWDRCIYCNSIRKYMNWKECPKFKESLGTTDAKNK